MARSSDLDALYRRLKKLAGRSRQSTYRIPALWNRWGYIGAERSRRGEVTVDPHRFLVECLECVILPARGERNLAGRSLSQITGVRKAAADTVIDQKQRRRRGDWIRRATLYGMLVRTTSAWDHDGDGRLRSSRWTETGTFLKSILLLPMLARMGIDTIYLLPISRCSRMFRKGEIGCPYSAKNMFELEPDLHDRLLGADASQVEMEFGAFVEAAHALDIRVMVDLAPRTTSRDSDLILDHPDWFYWIDCRCLRSYGAPRIDGIREKIPRTSQLADIFSRDALRRHLARFRHAPNISEPGRWRRFVQRCRIDPPRNLPREIARAFGVITPPGFSDCINDPQPPWSDVTFLRLFLDHPAASAKHLDDPAGQPPYVFTDTIKSSRFPGRRPNRALWKLLADVLPFYQRFGVDGARIDMGHALPPALQRRILEKPRGKDPDFCFLAEEFNHAAAAAARRDGYNAIIGECWSSLGQAAAGDLHRLIADDLPATKLPALAAAEIPDSRRAVVRDGGRRFARMAAVLNNFLPNAIPFANSGYELFERQPMNLGLDPRPPGRFALPRSDPYYGKLAYFDRVALHWGNTGAAGMIDLLERAGSVRGRFIADLAEPKNHFLPRVSINARSTVAVAWRVNKGRSTLLVVANIDFRRARRCTIEGLPESKHRHRTCETLLEIHSGPASPKPVSDKLRLTLGPGDAKVLLLGEEAAAREPSSRGIRQARVRSRR